MSGKNVYGVVRSGRSSSAETIILTTPLQPNNTHGVAVLLALAKYFNGYILTVPIPTAVFNMYFLSPTAKNFWAKDIIFLVTSQREVGMQAWINGYMGTQSTGNQKKCQKKVRSRQDLNLRGQSPIDF